MCADYDGTRDTLRERLAHSRAVYGSWTLRELQGAAGRPVAVSESEPGRGRGPKPGTPARGTAAVPPDQVDAAAAELDGSDQAAVILAAETGLRTSEWPALERRDVDRTGPVPVVHVQRRVVRGVVKPCPKTIAPAARYR